DGAIRILRSLSSGRPEAGPGGSIRATSLMGFASSTPSYDSAATSLQRDEIRHQIIAILFRHALENAHRGAGDHGGWKPHPAADGVLGPFPVGAVLERIGIAEPRHGAGLLADDAEQVRAEAIVAAFFAGVADRALPHERGLALGSVA